MSALTDLHIPLSTRDRGLQLVGAGPALQVPRRATPCAPCGAREDPGLLGMELTIQWTDCFHTLDAISVEKIIPQPGAWTFAQGFSSLLYLALGYAFILRQIGNVHRFWITSLPRMVSVTAYAFLWGVFGCGLSHGHKQ